MAVVRNFFKFNFQLVGPIVYEEESQNLIKKIKTRIAEERMDSYGAFIKKPR